MSGRDANKPKPGGIRPGGTRPPGETVREALAIGWPEGDHAEPNVFTEALGALDELVALVGTLQRERDGFREGWEQERELWKRRAEAAEAVLANRDEAIASALTSLATGPAKDGYAYSVLRAAAGSGTEHPGLEDAVGPAPKDQATLTPFESSAKPGITIGSTQGSTVDSKQGRRS